MKKIILFCDVCNGGRKLKFKNPNDNKLCFAKGELGAPIYCGGGFTLTY